MAQCVKIDCLRGITRLNLVIKQGIRARQAGSVVGLLKGKRRLLVVFGLPLCCMLVSMKCLSSQVF